MKTWDYIIIGGGSSGAVLAHRLSEQRQCQVLLLDAGRSHKHLASTIPAGVPVMLGRPDMNWAYMAEPDASRGGKVDMWPAGKMLGGGSAINGMMYVRGHRADYERWAALGNTGWSYEDVLPYFRKLEHFDGEPSAWRGQGGPQAVSMGRNEHPLDQAFIDAAVAMGMSFNPDLNGERAEGVGRVQCTQRNGLRASTAQAYLDPIADRDNLHIELGATVERVHIEDGVARGVVYHQNGQRHEISARQGVIVTAGALATPGVLLRSGVGAAQDLETLGVTCLADRPGVGQNLQEHAAVRVGFHSRIDTMNSDMGPLRNLVHGLNFLLRRRGPLSMCVGHAQAMVRSRPELAQPDLQIIFAPLAFEFGPNGPRPYPKPAAGFAVGLTGSHSRGKVWVDSADPMAKPRIDYPLVGDPRDMQSLIAGCRWTRELLGTDPMKSYVIDERMPGPGVDSDEQWEAFIRSEAFLMYHPCGTAKMGTDAQSVVNPQLQVHGLRGLWVADASVIPTIPAGNINATCIMIGEKAADLIQASAV